MKRKPAGSNRKTILSFLNEAGEATAAQIKRATKVKGNIYVTLGGMVASGDIQRVGKFYKAVLGSTNSVSPKREPVRNPLPAPNPNEALIYTLMTELEYVQDGITTLQTTKNYLVRRIEFLQNA